MKKLLLISLILTACSATPTSTSENTPQAEPETDPIPHVDNTTVEKFSFPGKWALYIGTVDNTIPDTLHFREDGRLLILKEGSWERISIALQDICELILIIP